MQVETIRREIERRLEQYKRMKPDGAKWLDDAVSIVNDVCDPYCPVTEPPEDETGDGMGFYPGFPPGFDPERAASGLGQRSGRCRNRAESSGTGSNLGDLS